MGILSTIKPQKLEKIILKFGYKFDRSKGSHRAYCKPNVAGTIIIPFHSKDDVPQFIVEQIIDKLGISRKEFVEILKKPRKIKKDYESN